MNKRSYGNNLDKLEPGDLNDCFCPNQSQFELIKEREVKEIIEIAKTNEQTAITASNELMDNLTS